MLDVIGREAIDLLLPELRLRSKDARRWESLYRLGSVWRKERSRTMTRIGSL